MYQSLTPISLPSYSFRSAARSTSSIACSFRKSIAQTPWPGLTRPSRSSCRTGARCFKDVGGRVKPGRGVDVIAASRPHAEAALAGFAQLFGQIGKFDREAAGVARIDDFLYPEGFGGTERRAQPVQA